MKYPSKWCKMRADHVPRCILLRLRIRAYRRDIYIIAELSLRRVLVWRIYPLCAQIKSAVKMRQFFHGDLVRAGIIFGQSPLRSAFHHLSRRQIACWFCSIYVINAWMRNKRLTRNMHISGLRLDVQKKEMQLFVYKPNVIIFLRYICLTLKILLNCCFKNN